MTRPPVDHVRISSRGKEILTQVKRKTGLEHWNSICRVALIRSLANSAKPRPVHAPDTAIELDWKTFAGQYQEVLAALVIQRAALDGVRSDSRDEMSAYFRAHLERGLTGMQKIRSLSDVVPLGSD
jgi:DNA sulfur modification protein DndE